MQGISTSAESKEERSKKKKKKKKEFYVNQIDCFVCLFYSLNLSRNSSEECNKGSKSSKYLVLYIFVGNRTKEKIIKSYLSTC
jgi:hypothetical protein